MSEHRALVTGASSGIGEAMAHQLASWGYSLVLSARRDEKLQALATRLREEHQVEVEVICADLAKPNTAVALWEAATGRQPLRTDNREITILINNAGVGAYQDFDKSEWAHTADLLQLNMHALAHLSHLFVGHALAHGRPSHLLHVSSLMAQLATPGFAAYNGSKAFVSLFSLSLALELRNTKISVSCLLPGGTTTEFTEVAGVTTSRLARMGMMSASRCANIGLRGMRRGKAIIVPGLLNKFIHMSSRWMPAKLVGKTSRWIVGAPPTTGK